MTKSEMNLEVDEFINEAGKWREELRKLRAILLDCGLTEELKWGQPCYTFQNNNVAILAELKNCCTLSFFKGALLEDTNNILSKPGENTRASRVIRFTGVRKIIDLKSVLKKYIAESVEIEKSNLKFDFRENAELDIPEEVQNQLDKNSALKAAFEALTPGRQRAYILYFSQPKQSKTREARIEKFIPRILDGKGLNDEPVRRKSLHQPIILTEK